MKLNQWITCIEAFLFTTFLNAQENHVTNQNKDDFISGEKILFQDDFQEYKVAEFPSRWKLINGRANVQLKDHKNVLLIKKGEYNKPLIKPDLQRENYLPESFTLEFDFYANDQSNDVLLFFKVSENKFNSIHFGSWVSTRDYLPTDMLMDWRYFETHPYVKLWHHGALSFKNGYLWMYIDGQIPMARIFCKFIPLEIAIGGSSTPDFPLLLRNFKLAEIVKTVNFDSLLSAGKMVSHAIHFDSNKSEIKVESFGYLKELAEWLKENPAVRLEISGHTDNNGNAKLNLKLSKLRAGSVKKQLELMGIELTRLSAKGFGATKPLESNATAEGKVSNRRVEFRKM